MFKVLIYSLCVLNLTFLVRANMVGKVIQILAFSSICLYFSGQTRPSKNSSKKRSIETFRGRQTPLDFCYGDLQTICLFWFSINYCPLTLYFEVEERRESRPGTEQNISVANTEGIMFSFILTSLNSGNPSSPQGSWWGEDKGWPMESWESIEDLSRDSWSSLYGKELGELGLELSSVSLRVCWREVTGYEGSEAGRFTWDTGVREGSVGREVGGCREARDTGRELNSCCCSWLSGGGKYGGWKSDAADRDVVGNIELDEGLVPIRSLNNKIY